MKKLLMICYYYPPLVDVGSLRSIAFSSHISELGWAPTVLTVSNPSKSYCRIGDTVAPEGVRVLRARSLFDAMAPINLLNGIHGRARQMLGLRPSFAFYNRASSLWLPDVFAPWIPGAIHEGMKWQEADFDAIYASCSPFSSAVIGAALKRRFQKPLVLDFRDPMSKRILREPESLPDRLRQKIEHGVLDRCDRLVVLTHEAKKRYLETYPFLEGKVSVIHNGYHESFLPVESPGPRRNSRFTIVYTGTFYQEAVPPEPFFNALETALERKWLPPDQLLFRYIGRPGPWLERLVRERSLQDQVEVMDYLPHIEVKKHVQESDVVLLRNLSPCCLSTKIYEGLALGKTFLGLLYLGESEEMVSKYSPASMICHPLDEQGIASAIKSLYERWEAGGLHDEVSKEYLAEFRWQALTFKLTTLLEEMCGEQTKAKGKNG